MEAFSSPYASLLATAPILWLLLGLAVLRLRASLVCPVGLAMSVALACVFWKFPPLYAAEAALDGAVFALIPILWIIIASYFSYNISLHTGADKQIKWLLSSLSPDPRMQVLLIAWGLGGFMESVAGFGTAVVIPTVLLISLGFSPFLAALVSLVANTVAVPFGVVGIPMQTLVWATDLDVFGLSSAALAQLDPLILALPFVLVFCVTKSLKGTLEVWFPTLVAGLSFAAAQYVVALHVGPELAAVAGSLVSILSMAAALRFFPVRRVWRLDDGVTGAGGCDAVSDSSGHVSPARAASGAGQGGVLAESPKGAKAVPLARQRFVLAEQVKAWSPYIFLFVLVLGSSRLVPPVNELFGQAKSVLSIYSGPGGKPTVIPWLLTPGTLAFVAAVLGGLWQGAKLGDLIRIYVGTQRRLATTCVTIISIICMAKVLSYSGMMLQLSGDLARVAGTAYPILAPFVGALGSFITGSNASANILFGGLQKQVALRLGLDPFWIAAANASGGCVGKMLSPQSIALAAVAAGLPDQEGRLLRFGLLYALPFLVALGALVFFLA